MDRHYIEIPGTHELPPLLVRAIPEEASRAELVHRATEIVETEGTWLRTSPRRLWSNASSTLLSTSPDQYLGLLTHWAWGDSVIEWIRQCETTFAATVALKHLLSHDVWPHAARCSFVDLLLG